MNNGGTARNQDSALERHAQTILASLILAGILGLVTLVFQGYAKFSDVTERFGKVTERFGDMQTHLAQIDERITSLQVQIAQTYRADDARRDTADNARQIEDVKRRLSVLEASSAARTQPKELQQWQRKN